VGPSNSGGNGGSGGLAGAESSGASQAFGDSSRGVVVTLITDLPPEQAQATLWRPIADRWPCVLSSPLLRVRSMESFLEGDADFSDADPGSVVLAVVDDRRDGASVYQLIDRLWDRAVGGLLLFTQLNEETERLGGKGVIVMERSADPSVIAAMLYALSERQATVDALKAELLTTRRFQGGLRGQMEKIHEELELAASVQREFLPKTLPNIGGIDFQVMFRPAGYVSGDIYDIQRLDEEHVGFFLADAVGHGVPAALMTMVLTRSLTTRVIEGSGFRLLPPAEVLERLNREMVERHDESPRFATAVYGVVNVRTRAVRIAGAGHPHPLVIGTGGQVRRIETSGGLLGVFADDTFDEAEFVLGPDESLVVYSDGFETAFPTPGADEYGRKVPTRHYLDHFVGMVGRWREADLATAFRQLAHNLDQQAGSLHQIDDLTVIMLAACEERELDRLFRGERSSQPAPAQRSDVVPQRGANS